MGAGEADAYDKLKEKYKKLIDKFSDKSDEILNLELKLSTALTENVINIHFFLLERSLF